MSSRSPGSRAQADVWSVTQLTRRVKHLLESDIGRVHVSGEISNWRVSPAGHAYFTLKDATSQLSCVIFRGRLNKLRFEPESGLEVIANGQVSVYEQRGQYQMICDGMQPQGLGALQLAYEKLKEKLDAEGLFAAERKKPLPKFPKRIGVVTSPTGAAIRDILNVLERRYAGLHVLLYPARVQGDGAAADIVKAIRALDAYGVDAMIVGRGGGSLEDLWPFNEEPVVRAIYKAKTPIISAVGHEIDYTLSDFAADVRAPTPSAAAEIVVQEHDALQQKLATLERRIARAVQYRLTHARHRLERAHASYAFSRPEELLREPTQRADDLRERLALGMRAQLDASTRRTREAAQAVALLSPRHQLALARERGHEARRRLHDAGRRLIPARRAQLRPAIAELDALSPLAILGRGYALAQHTDTGAIIRVASELKPGDAIDVRLGTGRVASRVEAVHEETE